MSKWEKNGDKRFIVKVPKSHHLGKFELLLKQMLIHYQVPVETKVREVPVEIECSCGYRGKAKVSDPENVMKILCPNCDKNNGKVVSGKEIEVLVS